ncbi:hypothetical protein HP439_11415 [Sphingobacterium shayense]|uniref:hypothetical protein n=1 Tax=Sphingobacterium shayense TaxID=626343 RepID=UPI0015543390|nr:hypothetical protein [Sphingobacterium shayense]NQD71329.1 hypothetical protein [Sphingobacterium shayense]
MLEIIHNGKALNLPPDIQIALTIENPLLKEDRIPTPFSLSFELPSTRHNLELFGWPNRIGSYKQANYVRTIPVDIRFHSITISKGHLKLTSYLETLKVTYSGIDYIEDIKSKLYEIDFGRETFDGSFSGGIDYYTSTNFAYSYKQWADSAVNTDRDDFVLAPVAILDKAMPFSRWESMDYQTKWIGQTSGYERFRSVYRYQDTAFFNQYNPWSSNFLIDRDLTYNYKVGTSHANVFPLFRVGHIFKTVMGSVLDNNMFLQGDLRNLVMPTFYYNKWTERLESQATDPTFSNRQFPPMVENPRPAWNQPYPSSPYIEYKNYMPDVSANDFIKELLSLFGMSLFPYKGKLQMRSNNDVMLGTVKADWTSLIIGNPELTSENKKAYVFGYSDSETYTATETFVSVNTIWDMASYPYTLDDEKFYEERFYIQETKQRFIKRAQQREINVISADFNIFSDELEYELIDDRLGVDLDVEGDKYTVEPKVNPLPLYPVAAFHSMENDVDLYDNTFYISAPALSVDRSKRSEIIPLVIYKGMRQVPHATTRTYPYASIYPDANNTLNLLWEGENGLIEKYHKNYKQWIERDKLRLKGTFLLNAIDLHKLDLGDKVHVRGRNFFVDKIQITLRANTIDPAVVDMVEA